MIVHAVNAEAAKRLAQRTDEPVDTGPSTKPDRAAQAVREGRDVTEACDEYRAAVASNPSHGMTHEAYEAKLAA